MPFCWVPASALNSDDMKKLFILALAAALCSFTNLRAQYHDYNRMSGGERRAYTKELLDIEPEDMRLTTNQILDLKREMQVFGNALQRKSSKEYWWGLGTFILAPTLVVLPIALAVDMEELLYVGYPVFMVGGAYLVAKSMVDSKRARQLLDKSRLLIAQSSTYPWELNLDGAQIAFGISATRNIQDWSATLGPSLSIRF